MIPCTNCASPIQNIVAAKAADQHVKAQAEEYARDHNTAVALYRDDRDRLCFIPADECVGYPVFAFISQHNLPPTP